MNEHPQQVWTGRFLTGKLIVPLGIASFVLQLMMPFTTIYRSLWNLFVVFPVDVYKRQAPVLTEVFEAFREALALGTARPQ